MDKLPLFKELEQLIMNSVPGIKYNNNINTILNTFSNSSFYPLTEKINSIRGWLDIYSSQRKFEKYGGADKVKAFILHDLESIKQLLKRID